MIVKDYKSYPLSYVRQLGPKQMVIVYLDRIERLAVRREGKQIELVLDFKAGQQVPLPIPDLDGYLGGTVLIGFHQVLVVRFLVLERGSRHVNHSVPCGFAQAPAKRRIPKSGKRFFIWAYISLSAKKAIQGIEYKPVGRVLVIFING